MTGLLDRVAVGPGQIGVELVVVAEIIRDLGTMLFVIAEEARFAQTGAFGLRGQAGRVEADLYVTPGAF